MLMDDGDAIGGGGLWRGKGDFGAFDEDAPFRRLARDLLCR